LGLRKEEKAVEPPRKLPELPNPEAEPNPPAAEAEPKPEADLPAPPKMEEAEPEEPEGTDPKTEEGADLDANPKGKGAFSCGFSWGFSSCRGFAS
jgi:hypothetical protein